MSYSFSVIAASKAEAREKVSLELARVIEAQEIHKADADQASAAANAFIDLLRDDDSQDISVVMYGSLSWSEAGISSANVSVTTGLVKRGA